MRKIFWIVLAVLFMLLVCLGYVFFGVSGVFMIIFGEVLYVLFGTTIIALVYVCMRYVFGKLVPKYSISFTSFFSYIWLRIALILGYICVFVPLVIAFILYGYNTWWYGEVDRYELVGEDKQIIFQSMSHIASPQFYDAVIDDIRDAGEDGYVLFYEGVRPGTAENEEAFTQALGFSVDRDLYTSFGKLAQLEFQGERDFLGYAQEDINVDLSIDDIMQIYEQKHPDTPDPVMPVSIDTMFDDLETSYNALSPKMQTSISYGYRAMFNAMLRMVQDAEIGLPTGDVPVFQVILEDRNKHIAKQIRESGYEKIYLIYGALHFEGILAELQSYGNWEIVDRESLRIIY